MYLVQFIINKNLISRTSHSSGSLKNDWSDSWNSTTSNPEEKVSSPKESTRKHKKKTKEIQEGLLVNLDDDRNDWNKVENDAWESLNN